MRQPKEIDVVALMVRIYCRAHHSKVLCEECQELLDYATKRLKKCPIEESKKSSCRLCKIHCYDRAHADHVRRIMRYSAPRMLFYNPIMALSHLLRERRG